LKGALRRPFWTPATNRAEGGWRASVITASALKTKTFNPIKLVVSGYIPEGVTIFAGKPKIGKSWLLYDSALPAPPTGSSPVRSSRSRAMFSISRWRIVTDD
jgi:hypothetical protein